MVGVRAARVGVFAAAVCCLGRNQASGIPPHMSLVSGEQHMCVGGHSRVQKRRCIVGLVDSLLPMVQY